MTLGSFFCDRGQNRFELLRRQVRDREVYLPSIEKSQRFELLRWQVRDREVHLPVIVKSQRFELLRWQVRDRGVHLRWSRMGQVCESSFIGC